MLASKVCLDRLFDSTGKTRTNRDITQIFLASKLCHGRLLYWDYVNLIMTLIRVIFSHGFVGHQLRMRPDNSKVSLFAG